jgi:HEPN domain-containing protein
MKQAARDWVKKAEEDYLAALDLARRRKKQLHNSVCFHCQQSAEKYLKARIEEVGLRIPKTYDLESLLTVLLPVAPLWAALRPQLQNLTDFAVDFRYPGNEANKQDAKTALRDCKSVHKEVRLALGLWLSLNFDRVNDRQP